MNDILARYQAESARLAVYPDKRQGAIIYLGLVGEAIEVMEVLFDQTDRYDRVKIERELGDVLWYVSAICDELGLSMQDLVQDGIESIPFIMTRQFGETWARALVVHAGRVGECFKKRERDGHTTFTEQRLEMVVENLEQAVARIHLIASVIDSSIESVLTRNLAKLVERAAEIRAEAASRNGATSNIGRHHWFPTQHIEFDGNGQGQTVTIDLAVGSVPDGIAMLFAWAMQACVGQHVDIVECGPIGNVVACHSFDDFRRVFGSDSDTHPAPNQFSFIGLLQGDETDHDDSSGGGRVFEMASLSKIGEVMRVYENYWSREKRRADLPREFVFAYEYECEDKLDLIRIDDSALQRLGQWISTQLRTRGITEIPEQYVRIDRTPTCGRCLNPLTDKTILFTRRDDDSTFHAYCSNCRMSLLKLPSWMAEAVAREVASRGNAEVGMGLCNGHWVVRLIDGYRFPETTRSLSTTDRRRIIEELWDQDPDTRLLQIDVYANGDITVSIPPRTIG